ncbi:hypothetical protein M9H77_05065 [Catharanthus roseus]|uniref:Uncharacterized protein n=1 Tax=Catharanthus roseus TaxID=4058 RepID=A0ACC0CG60_CATRO|nr:hypothetical protein M9H77_05065 [Catharanthus roseus]
MVLHLDWAVPATTSSVYLELLPDENGVVDSFKEKMDKFPVLFLASSRFCVTWICGWLILDISSRGSFFSSTPPWKSGSVFHFAVIIEERLAAGSVRLVRGTKLKD